MHYCYTTVGLSLKKKGKYIKHTLKIEATRQKLAIERYMFSIFSSFWIALAIIFDLTSYPI